ncbi:glucosaminidase domain-containing protein [Spirosoma oryzicola]|uniref:glucosaminidase domain-containing protein n=1 Tax=Spirosoma oryzicola TaxID=2898794 RepID=UPI001E3299F1|nr:glucosaminidase domain-containing protein [Spirosoma oryzicola]UHG90105.1 glucosaminidase domain-containing protein [Spirosoma oryzicola]
MITETELLYPETAVAIAVLETGNFSSRHMMKTHNWFGFRRNSRGYQKCVRKGYGEYASAQMMMADYQAWEYDICTKNGLTDERAFRRWIVKHYAEDPAYSTKLSTSLAEVNRTWR